MNLCLFNVFNNLASRPKRKGAAIHLNPEVSFALGGTAEMAFSPTSFGAPAAADRHCFVVGGGEGCQWWPLPSCDRPRLRCASAVVVAPDGSRFVIQAGGIGGRDALRSCEVFIHRTNVPHGCWRSLRQLPWGLHSAGAAVIDGSLYLVGGRRDSGSGGKLVKEILSIDICAGQGGDIMEDQAWKTVGNLEVGCWSPGVGKVGRCLVIVGGGQGAKSLGTCHSYDPRTGLISRGPDLREARESAQVCGDSDGLWVFGGYNEKKWLQSVEFLPNGGKEWKLHKDFAAVLRDQKPLGKHLRSLFEIVSVNEVAWQFFADNWVDVNSLGGEGSSVDWGNQENPVARIVEFGSSEGTLSAPSSMEPSSMEVTRPRKHEGVFDGFKARLAASKREPQLTVSTSGSTHPSDSDCGCPKIICGVIGEEHLPSNILLNLVENGWEIGDGDICKAAEAHLCKRPREDPTFVCRAEDREVSTCDPMIWLNDGESYDSKISLSLS